MSRSLVVVESPAKAKTLKKFLGRDYEVLASYGHVRDLVPKEGAVDPKHDFAMKYQVIERNERHVDAIARALKRSDSLLLATDPDREGEAIAWHVVELMKERDVLDDKAVHRVVFHEITRRAIEEAVANPHDLSNDLVNAQQARRVLDYLVGFNLSPLLWKKIRRGLSAGRVQSPALRLIVERENEIAAFVAREYWTIDAELEKEGRRFPARLTVYAGEKLEQFSLQTEAQARAAERAIGEAATALARSDTAAPADRKLRVETVTRKERRRSPPPPFTTSTLQQDAARRLGFGTQKTMRTAQRLYEGINTGDGEVGLISYMRTDSTNLAAEALSEIRAFVAERFGADHVPDQARFYKTKAKNAQEAHEAIRPTSIARTPESLRSHLDTEQFRLYELIWKRTVACQMINALYDTVAVDFATGAHRFRANGSILVEPGFLAVYQEGREDQEAEGADEQDRVLPPLSEGETVPLLEIRPEQHFTEPPPRYSEASLVKALEEYGIGRPSTYASIISTLLQREYVELDKRRFIATDVGRIVNDFLTNHFSRYVDYEFTARMEDALDAISRGEEDWVPLMHQFWNRFEKEVREKDATVTRDQVAQARDLGVDPASGKPVSVRMGRYGPFVQIGTRDDEEKPRFAGLRPGQRMSTITLEEGLALFALPRDLGETPEGEAMGVGIGRFGPYVRYGSKFVSIKQDDPYTITRERAIELIEAKKHADANRTIKRFDEAGIQILRGRYGPYVTDGNRNGRIPKDRDPATLTLEECRALIEAAPPPRGTKGKRAKPAEAAAGAGESPTAARKPRRSKAAAESASATEVAARKTTRRSKTAVHAVPTDTSSHAPRGAQPAAPAAAKRKAVTRSRKKS
jgi:DNA topoisomerase-1